MASHSRRAEICATALFGLLAAAPGAWAQAQSSTTNNTPAGMVAYYTAPGNPTTLDCPADWTQYQDGQGRLILGTTVAGEVGTKSNAAQPTADGQVPTHQHPFTATWNLNKQKSVGGSGQYKPFASSGGQSGGGTSGWGDSGYGFIQFLVCSSTTSTGDEVPVNTIGYFTTQTCPANWSPQTTLNGYFPLPVAPNGPVSSTYNAPGWHVGSFPTHTHPNATVASFAVQKLGVQYSGIASGAKASTDSVPVSAQLQANTTDVLPAVALLVCQKTQGSGTGSGVPSGISLFYSQANSCPVSTWGPAVGAPGYLILGISGSTSTGAGSFSQGLPIGSPLTPGGTNPGHTHPISITADLGENTTGGTSGTVYYGMGGNYTATGTTSSATIAVPYVALLLCQAG
ncbi:MULTISPECIES: hypothetical protein [unclassified Inquilinus]|uniref:hypothetical protein n=1 Tax=unclassified Inquilinus TaxID=2645927 RepID=UPI003F8E3D2C